ncbi:MAG: glycerophosphodiester phosphodiesterase, partial [Hydrogenophaga sp.]
NTFAAFRLGATHGYRMFECDVKLSSDGVPFLLHDNTLERTTNGHGIAGDLPWASLSQLDAGAWHSSSHANEPLPSLEAIAQFCQAHGFWLNIEIKPTKGKDAITGQQVALAATRLWADQPFEMAPLLTSFQPAALAAAQMAAPQLRRGLLMDTVKEGWQREATQLECQALICNHRLWNAELREEARSLGLRALAYTVNEPEDAARLLDLQLDGIITDRLDRFKPDR